MKTKKYNIRLYLFLLVGLNITIHMSAQKYNTLTEKERYVIIDKGTERPFTGKYTDFKGVGAYACKQCDALLYLSKDKFNSQCGWPSFDDEIKGAVDRVTDADGRRTEIICSNCKGHLGHVFEGEGFTLKNTRHCVNSISLKFVPEEELHLETAIFAAGCFWGVEHYLKNAKGVISTSVGYIGGEKDNPTYKEVCYTNTGHAEAVQVVFNQKQTNFETLAKLFFEIHDPTQTDGQGPDIGNQYRSGVFYTNEKQKETTVDLINYLKGKGLKVVTEVTPATEFWHAELYHQDYYDKTGKKPYCHFRTKRFE